ncbi:hypothetical protein GGI23_000605 [Coemansia sp. RSA 2559]|nr:hypothetical protein GGI23_000605 [Coemansia sp. RSA 2559]KAJ2853259.1 hypothetical protein GGI22_004936 [Coemansia erecta]
MWNDEMQFDDDEAAMEAYRQAVEEEGVHTSDDDDDFQPVSASRRKAGSKPRKPSAPKSKKTTRKRNPSTSQSGPRPVPRLAVAIDSSALSNENSDQNVDIDGEVDEILAIKESLECSSSVGAMPTPDIGELKVTSSISGSPLPDSVSVNSMDVDSTEDLDTAPMTALQRLRKREQSIREHIAQIEKEIVELEKKCGLDKSADSSQNKPSIDLNEFKAPEWSVPIRANVMNFEWERLAKACQFDVILMDPPWQLASQAPTRGVAIAYQQLPDVCIESLPIHLLQENGFIFIWVINNKYTKAFRLMKQWGYTYVDDIAWVKQTVNRRMAKGHGYYLQHAKETCLVGKKGADPPNLQRSVASDVIFSERRGQSQKPEEMYEIIEQLVPGGKYLEIFGRKNNLRDYWVTIGNEL